MQLTKEENEMLDGKYGEAVQKSMEILVAMGECYDAEKMIPVASAHLLHGRSNTGKAGALFDKEMADKGGKCIIFTDTNPSGIEPWAWRDIGISEEAAQEQMDYTNDFVRMGVFLANTCTPYLIGNVPRVGGHVAWSESSAVPFVNSVLGARTNREGEPGSLTAAITGRTPAFGYHLDQNRYGDLKISVTAKLKEPHDYATLGHFAGKVAEDRVPVFTGIPPSVSWDDLKLMGAAAATSGSISLYHVVGITPEAPTEEAAFGPKKPSEIFEFGEKELRETEESLSKATAREVDMVIFGCPHASIGEIRDIARLLSGKKLKSGVELWILTPRMIGVYAEKMGYLNVIKEAGGRILCDSCPICMSQGFLKERGHKIVATNSAKMTYYIYPHQGLLPYYGSMERCVEAAISGIWR